MYDLYVVTDKKSSNGLSHEEVVRLACRGGADAIQLRDKEMSRDEMIAVAKKMKKIADAHNTIFIVNDRVDVAIASGADGVHVGQTDMCASDVRHKIGDEMILGVSVSNIEEAYRAVDSGADYIGVGPIFDTTSKNDAGKGIGLEMLYKIRQLVDVPIVAIGGINTDNVKDVVWAGADGVAVISAVVSQPNVKDAASELRKMIVDAKS